MINARFFFVLLALFSYSILQAQDKPEGLFINSKAPDFKATDQAGNSFRLKDALKEGTVIMIFYRGHWCPYCSRQLKQLEDSLSFITEKGARLVAITPEKMDGIGKTIEKTGASYTILYDEGKKIMQAYDVDFEVDERTAARYRNAKIDLNEINAQKGQPSLPIPAVYIINKEGTIDYRYFNEDYKKRPSVKEILDNIRK